MGGAAIVLFSLAVSSRECVDLIRNRSLVIMLDLFFEILFDVFIVDLFVIRIVIMIIVWLRVRLIVIGFRILVCVQICVRFVMQIILWVFIFFLVIVDTAIVRGRVFFVFRTARVRNDSVRFLLLEIGMGFPHDVLLVELKVQRWYCYFRRSAPTIARIALDLVATRVFWCTLCVRSSLGRRRMRV